MIKLKLYEYFQELAVKIDFFLTFNYKNIQYFTVVIEFRQNLNLKCS